MGINVLCKRLSKSQSKEDEGDRINGPRHAFTVFANREITQLLSAIIPWVRRACDPGDGNLINHISIGPQRLVNFVPGLWSQRQRGRAGHRGWKGGLSLSPHDLNCHFHEKEGGESGKKSLLNLHLECSGKNVYKNFPCYTRVSLRPRCDM